MQKEAVLVQISAIIINYADTNSNEESNKVEVENESEEGIAEDEDRIKDNKNNINNNENKEKLENHVCILKQSMKNLAILSTA